MVETNNARRAVETISRWASAGLLTVVQLGCDNSDVSLPLVAQLTSADEARPLRLTQEYFRYLKGRTRKDLSLEINAAWKPVGKTQKVIAGDGLEIRNAAAPPAIVLSTSFDADEFNELVVRMKVDRGTECAVRWTSDIIPSFEEINLIEHPILADGKIHTYHIPLTTTWDYAWVGAIQSIQFSPSDEPARAEIVSMTLRFQPPEGPRRITIGRETREALFGSLPEWTFVVPPGATFETYVGIVGGKSRLRANRVRFGATLEMSGGNEISIGRVTVYPTGNTKSARWTPIRFDLSPYANKKVSIRFKVETRDSARGGFAFWGNPIVYSTEPPEETTPVILISCDTLRADHLSCYGYHRQTTPFIDDFAREAVLFENAFVQETYTLPSHMTMLTGLYPKNHRVVPESTLSEEIVTLAESVREHAYMTAAFTGAAGYLEPWYGFSHGFDIYNAPTADEAYRSIFVTMGPVQQWLNDYGANNFFLFFHNFDSHDKPAFIEGELPYGPLDASRLYSPRVDTSRLYFAKGLAKPDSLDVKTPNGRRSENFMVLVNRGEIVLDEAADRYLQALYDDAIRSVDLGVHDFLEDLKERGIYDRSLIIITSDHGEDLKDHGLYGHWSVYDECSRVPLIIKFPHGRFAGTRIEAVVQSVDIFPTVLDVLDIPVPGSVDGVSLQKVLTGDAELPDYAYTQRLMMKAVRDKEWKFVEVLNAGQTFELFHLPSDPHETNNRYDSDPRIAKQMKEVFDDFYIENLAGWHIYWRKGSEVKTSQGGVRASARLTTSDTIVTARRLIGEHYHYDNNLQASEHSVEINLGIVHQEEVIVRSARPDTSLSFEFKATGEVLIQLGDGEGQIASSLDTVLDVSARTYSRPATLPESDGARPVLVVWYEEPPSEGPSRKLSEQERRQLEALGYVN